MLTGLLFLSAFLIEGIGTFVSVIGLSSLFSSNPIIIALAVALDIGKLVSVSFLYKYWEKINVLMKTYMTAAAIVLIMITSAGAFGFLSSEFQKAMSSTNQQNVILQALTDEQSRLQKRKEEIDRQIAQLPETFVRGRTQLLNQFGPEVKRINDRLAAIDEQLPALRVDSIKKNVEVGPIMYIADAFSTTPEKASKWVILIIIFVFDPLAIALLLAGNFLLMEKQKNALRHKDEESNDHPKNEMPSDAAPKSISKNAIVTNFKSDDNVLLSSDADKSIVEHKVENSTNESIIEELDDLSQIDKTKDEIKNTDDNKLEFPNIMPQDAIIQVIEEKLDNSEKPQDVQTKLLEQIQAVRSSLEDLEVRKSDVEFANEQTSGTRELRNLYSELPVGVGKTGIPLDKK